MNSRFTEEQIEWYATYFRKGDAVWASDKWYKFISPQFYTIEMFTEGLYQYKVVTMNEYYPSVGDRIVWLGESNSSLNFGSLFEVQNNDKHNTYSECFIVDNEGVSLYLYEHESLHKYFGVIPKFENVRELTKDARNKERSQCTQSTQKIPNLDVNLMIDELDTFLSIDSFIDNIFPYYELLMKIDKQKGNKLMQQMIAFTRACDSVNKQRNEHTRQLLK